MVADGVMIYVVESKVYVVRLLALEPPGDEMPGLADDASTGDATPGRADDASASTKSNEAFAYGQIVCIGGLAETALNGQRAVTLPKSHSADARRSWEQGRVPILYRPSGGIAKVLQFRGVEQWAGDRVLSVRPENLGEYGLNNPLGVASELGEKLYWECSRGVFENSETANLTPRTSEVRRLILRGACVNFEHQSNGGSVLNSACMGNNEDVVRLLLDAGADPDFPEDSGGSLFYTINPRSSHRNAELLLQYGANPNARIEGGSSVLSLVQGMVRRADEECKGVPLAKRSITQRLTLAYAKNLLAVLWQAANPTPKARPVPMLPQMSRSHCAQCGKRRSGCEQQGLKLRKCDQCATVRYCSRECQKVHWKASHREICKQIVKERDRAMAVADE